MNKRSIVATAVLLAIGAAPAYSSSHREAPFITEHPKVDGTDFYMFMSYEANRAGYVTLIANYDPLQDAYGGPNYFELDPNALYEIHIDNNGDSQEDLTFQFRFSNTFGQANIPALNVTNGKVPVSGGPADGVEIPLVNLGAGTGASPGALNVTESYTLTLVRGNRRTGTPTPVTGTDGKTVSFTKPIDNIGTKSIPDYANYAKQYVYDINVPGCMVNGTQATGRVFVGQRREGFVVNLGQVFDQVNLNPLGARNSTQNVIGNKNITSLALEIPASCLTAGSDPVIGAWTTASLRQARLQNGSPTGPKQSPATDGVKAPEVAGGPWTQVSRLGHPLVNEVVIGITDKDKFNASQPKDDVANFGNYVLYPTCRYWSACCSMCRRRPRRAMTFLRRSSPASRPRSMARRSSTPHLRPRRSVARCCASTRRSRPRRWLSRTTWAFSPVTLRDFPMVVGQSMTWSTSSSPWSKGH